MKPKNHFPVYAFDANGNRVILADARKTPSSAGEIFQLLKQYDLASLLEFSPEMYSVLTQGVRGVMAHFWNPDSTPELVCGNALRCVPFVVRQARNPKSPDCRVLIETQHDDFESYLTGSWRSAVDFPIGKISIERLSDGDFLINPGSPHRVRFVDDLHERGVSILGRKWSRCSKPCNGTFVKAGDGLLEVRTFERGVGETSSCGTGAVAAFLAYTCSRDSGTKAELINIRFDSGAQFVIRREIEKAIVSLEGSCALLSTCVLWQSGKGEWKMTRGDSEFRALASSFGEA
jgi:diaminopimelate epimerase